MLQSWPLAALGEWGWCVLWAKLTTVETMFETSSTSWKVCWWKQSIKKTKSSSFQSHKELPVMAYSEVPVVLGAVQIAGGLNLSLDLSWRVRGWWHFESVTIITHPNYHEPKPQLRGRTFLCWCVQTGRCKHWELMCCRMGGTERRIMQGKKLWRDHRYCISVCSGVVVMGILGRGWP